MSAASDGVAAASMSRPAAGDAGSSHTRARSAARSVAELDHGGTPSHQVYTAGFYDSPWDYAVRSLLGKAFRGGADAGEVLATIATVQPGDRAAWFDAWTHLGSRTAQIAADCIRDGHRVSASQAYLRAGNYFSVALNSIDGLNGIDALLPTFRSARSTWDGFVATTHWPVERVDIPYEDSSMPGWLFHPDTSTTAKPTLVVNNGSDGSPPGVWCGIAQGGLERGYRVLLFDGPGQQSMLFERGVPFRHDWEKVLTPVVDFLTERSDVDTSALAVYGISQAGYWVPRALAFEHRFAAAVVDGGAVDIGRPWRAELPSPILDLYHSGKKKEFDRQMARVMSAPAARAAQEVWAFRARPYGASGYSAVLDVASQYRLDDLPQHISTPLFITDADGEQLLPGQSADLANRTSGATLVRFTQEEGASFHCQPMARALTEQRIFDWLDDQISADHASVLRRSALTRFL